MRPVRVWIRTAQSGCAGMLNNNCPWPSIMTVYGALQIAITARRRWLLTCVRNSGVCGRYTPICSLHYQTRVAEGAPYIMHERDLCDCKYRRRTAFLRSYPTTRLCGNLISCKTEFGWLYFVRQFETVVDNRIRNKHSQNLLSSSWRHSDLTFSPILLSLDSLPRPTATVDRHRFFWAYPFLF